MASITRTFAMLAAIASAVKLAHDEDTTAELSLDADLSLPLSVALGKATFVGRATECPFPYEEGEKGGADQAISDEQIQAEPELSTEEATTTTLAEESDKR